MISGPGPSAPGEPLPEEVVRVVELVARGWTDDRIARALGVSVSTAKRRLRAAQESLGGRSASRGRGGGSPARAHRRRDARHEGLNQVGHADGKEDQQGETNPRTKGQCPARDAGEPVLARSEEDP